LILVDSTIWIEFLRERRALDLEAIVPFDEVVTCLPVIQEVLQGIRVESAYRAIREAMFALPIVEPSLGAAVFSHAIDIYRLARRSGYTVRSSTDCLIAACAIRHDLEVLHRDRDFTAISEISALRQRTP
jgi:predicted nucleic acid-binding protein